MFGARTLSFLRFAMSTNVMEIDAIRHVEEPSGRETYGTLRASIFMFFYAMPDFRPTNDTNTLGLSTRV